MSTVSIFGIHRFWFALLIEIIDSGYGFVGANRLLFNSIVLKFDGV